jgi:hypothetical protein
VRIDVKGYFCVDEKQKDICNDDIYLDSKVYSLSVRRLNVEDLVIVDYEKVIGSFLSFVILTMVVNTNGSLIPFYIDEKDKSKLQALIDKYKQSDVIIL